MQQVLNTTTTFRMKRTRSHTTQELQEDLRKKRTQQLLHQDSPSFLWQHKTMQFSASVGYFGAVLDQQLSDEQLEGLMLHLQPQETRVPIACLIEYFTLQQHLWLLKIQSGS